VRFEVLLKSDLLWGYTDQTGQTHLPYPGKDSFSTPPGNGLGNRLGNNIGLIRNASLSKGIS
jgi:hypothetical protein